MNKKGVEITLNFIVIAAIVLIALIVAILFFTGTTEKLFKKQAEVTQLSTQELNLAKSICESHCSQQNEASYNNPSFSQAIRDAGYDDCKDLLDKPFADCKGSCKAKVGEPNANCPTYTDKKHCEDAGCVWG